MTKQERNCPCVTKAVHNFKNIIESILYKNAHPWLIFENPNLTKSWKEIDEASPYIITDCCECPNCLDLSMLHKTFTRFAEGIRTSWNSINEFATNFPDGQVIQNINTDYIAAFKEDIFLSKHKFINIAQKHSIDKGDIIAEKLFDLNQDIINKLLSLKMEYVLFKQTDCHDTILNETGNLKLELSDWKDSEISKDAVIVYFDQNAISKYSETVSIKEKIATLKRNHNFVFVYSPYSTEELLKKEDGKWQKGFMDVISELTENHILIKDRDDGNKIVVKRELPIYSLYRAVVMWRMTEAAQQWRFLKYEEGEIMLMQTRDKKITAKIGHIDLEKTALRQDETGEFIRSVYRHCVGLEYKQGSLSLSADEEENFIYNCSNFLTLIGFKKDKTERTQRSNFFDIEHAIYARDCDFFITDDKSLQTRISYIYQKISKRGRVCSMEDFLEETDKLNMP